MNTITINNKSYVILPLEEYEALHKKAALKSRPEKLLSLEEAKKYSKRIIHKLSLEK